MRLSEPTSVKNDPEEDTPDARSEVYQDEPQILDIALDPKVVRRMKEIVQSLPMYEDHHVVVTASQGGLVPFTIEFVSHESTRKTLANSELWHDL